MASTETLKEELALMRAQTDAEIRLFKTAISKEEINELYTDESAHALVHLESGTIYDATRDFEQLFGYESRGQLVGEHFKMLIPERIHAIHDQHYETWRKNPERRPMRGFVGKRRDGSEFHLQLELRPRKVRSIWFAVLNAMQLQEK